MPEQKPKRWRHARKGLITGHVINRTADWTWIELVGEHKPKMQSKSNQGTVWADGDIIHVRTVLLEEL